MINTIGPYSFRPLSTGLSNSTTFRRPVWCWGGYGGSGLRNLPPDILFNSLCETNKCLPDAVQLLTPCTVGNGWLKVRIGVGLPGPLQ